MRTFAQVTPLPIRYGLHRNAVRGALSTCGLQGHLGLVSTNDQVLVKVTTHDQDLPC